MQIKEKILPYITDIIAQLQQAGFDAYIVGGAVRDLLLDRIPKDYDISTSATPEQIRKVFRDRRTIIIGKRFRLVHLFHHGDIVEISTFRKCPQPQQELRRPGKEAPENMIFQDNEFGTAREDAWRRDFTVNALFYDPVNARILDYTGMGLHDIQNNCVRSIGNPALRFEEDPVRILRALKLVGQYGFKLEEETGKAVADCMDFIDHASGSRLTLELEKILKNPYGHRILRAFHEYKFLKKFLPFIEQQWDTPACNYMLALLEERNRRVRCRLYRDSISLAMSIFTLPFAEKIIGANEPGGLWHFLPDIHEELWDLLHTVLAPAALTRRASSAAIRTLSLQERLKNRNLKRLFSHPGYPHARELAIIQNNVLWHMDDFEDSLPSPAPAQEKHRVRRHERSRKEAGKNIAERVFV
ncbi:MAG: Poly(A) polymerase I precursor [Lentisphaerae bacterium ADurb.Bin242]|nr:MAG: Poly(A) polymerase I precursor [Lentisphaerae bacterium ADurb.Bin242]